MSQPKCTFVIFTQIKLFKLFLITQDWVIFAPNLPAHLNTGPTRRHDEKGSWLGREGSDTHTQLTTICSRVGSQVRRYPGCLETMETISHERFKSCPSHAISILIRSLKSWRQKWKENVRFKNAEIEENKVFIYWCESTSMKARSLIASSHWPISDFHLKNGLHFIEERYNRS